MNGSGRAARSDRSTGRGGAILAASLTAVLCLGGCGSDTPVNSDDSATADLPFARSAGWGEQSLREWCETVDMLESASATPEEFADAREDLLADDLVLDSTASEEQREGLGRYIGAVQASADRASLETSVRTLVAEDQAFADFMEYREGECWESSALLPETPEPETPGYTTAWSMSLVDQDGYQVGIRYDASLSSWTLDRTSYKPGFTGIYPTSTSALTVTNETPQRMSPTPTLSLIVLYPAESVVCRSGMRTGFMISGDPLTSFGENHCGITVRTHLYNSPVAGVPPTLEPEQVLTAELEGEQESSTGGRTGEISLRDDGSVKKIEKALNYDGVLVLGISSTWRPEGDLYVTDDETGEFAIDETGEYTTDQSCRLDNGMTLVPGGPGVC